MNNIFKKSLIATVILISFAILEMLIQNRTIFPNVTFVTIEGRKINIADLRGKVLLINFWATDCQSCISEMPALVRTYQQYKKKGFEIIAIAMPYDPPEQVLNYTILNKLPFPVMHDGFAEMIERFGNVELTPTTFIFDKQGKLLQRTIGRLDFVRLNQLLKSELATKQ